MYTYIIFPRAVFLAFVWIWRHEGEECFGHGVDVIMVILRLLLLVSFVALAFFIPSPECGWVIIPAKFPPKHCRGPETQFVGAQACHSFTPRWGCDPQPYWCVICRLECCLGLTVVWERVSSRITNRFSFWFYLSACRISYEYKSISRPSIRNEQVAGMPYPLLVIELRNASSSIFIAIIVHCARDHSWICFCAGPLTSKTTVCLQ